MKKYRTKPAVVAAVVLDLNNKAIVSDWLGATYYDLNPLGLVVKTPARLMMVALSGEWIIKGAEGEFYYCKDDIFWATYEEVEDCVAMYRTKPAVVEAVRLTKDDELEIRDWLGAAYLDGTDLGLYVTTPTRTLMTAYGEWIIKGADGEFYYCEDAMFQATYEEED
ncbi:MAG: hypothetical protein LBQ12_08475 [Deltaproteobacteria bacterium]|jgi:hypothetical protein|nr:hypothetical protein [Deltaproteobacteria bacterium]